MPVIVSTAPDGMVNITAPATVFMSAVTHGGIGRIPNASIKRAEAAAQSQIDRAIESGYDADFASRFVKALVLGGETDAGGLDLIRQRHLFHDSNHRVQDAPALDRFFRDAWRQESVSGALFVDLATARQVFAKRLIAVKAGRVREFADRTEVAVLLGQRNDALEAAHASLKAIDLHAIADQMAKAGSPEELKMLWPAVLPIDENSQIKS